MTAKWRNTQSLTISIYLSIRVEIIRYSIESCIANSKYLRAGLKLSKVNGNTFESSMLNKVKNYENRKAPYNHITEYDQLCANIKESLKETGATAVQEKKRLRNKRKKKRNPNSWWNKSCQDQIEARKKAARELKKKTRNHGKSTKKTLE